MATISSPDGRVLQVLDTGGDGVPCVFHSGTPDGAVRREEALEAARGAGLRWITFSRPGYGDSTPLPGRTVAQVAEDTAVVLDALGAGSFVTYGISGGGPHALACAALMPGRCTAAASVAGVAPWDADGLDWLAGMGDENVEEFGLAAEGREPLQEWLVGEAADMPELTGADVAKAFGEMLPDVDRGALTGDFADTVAASLREAVRNGVDGWLDDDLAFVRPWGFALDDLQVPVAVWQGGQDLMVPAAHGEWLAAHVSGAVPHLLPQHGHLSLAVAALDEILADLRTLAG